MKYSIFLAVLMGVCALSNFIIGLAAAYQGQKLYAVIAGICAILCSLSALFHTAMWNADKEIQK